jgi:hypothetical protein
LIVQLLPVTAPVKVMVPSEAMLENGAAIPAANPAAATALLTHLFMLSSQVSIQPTSNPISDLTAASRFTEAVAVQYVTLVSKRRLRATLQAASPRRIDHSVIRRTVRQAAGTNF